MMKRNVGEIVTFGSYMQDAGSDEKKPIEWIVMETNKSGMLLLSLKVLDGQAVNDPHKKGYEVREDISDEVFESLDKRPLLGAWASTTLRRWLNEDFYNTAFSEDERGMIIGTKVQTKYNLKYGSTGGPDVTDKIFIPSVEDIINTDYGFNPVPKRDDKLRRCQPTDYAVSKGVRVTNMLDSRGEPIVNGCGYWLRTAGRNGDNTVLVTFYGGILLCGYYSSGINGIRPMIKVLQ